MTCFGHYAGDEVLRQVCAEVTALLQPGMHMGRMGATIHHPHAWPGPGAGYCPVPGHR